MAASGRANTVASGSCALFRVMVSYRRLVAGMRVVNCLCVAMRMRPNATRSVALSSLQLAYTLVPFGTIDDTRTCPKLQMSTALCSWMGTRPSCSVPPTRHSTLTPNAHWVSLCIQMQYLFRKACHGTPDSALIVPDDPLHEGRPALSFFVATKSRP